MVGTGHALLGDGECPVLLRSPLADGRMRAPHDPEHCRTCAPGACRRSGRTFRPCGALYRRDGPARGKACRFAAAHARRHARLELHGRRRHGLARILAGHARSAGARVTRSVTITERLQALAAALLRLIRLSDAAPHKGFHGVAAGDALRPRLFIAAHSGGELGTLTADTIQNRGLHGGALQPFGPRVIPAAGDDRLVRRRRRRRGA